MVLIQPGCQKTPGSHHMVVSSLFFVSLYPGQQLSREFVAADGWLDLAKHYELSNQRESSLSQLAFAYTVLMGELALGQCFKTT